MATRQQAGDATHPAAKESAPTMRAPNEELPEYEFRNHRQLRLDSLRALDAVHQEQFFEATALYTGERYDTLDEAVAGTAKVHGYDVDDFSIDLWDVVEAGESQPAFEYWVQGAGDGAVFEAGNAEPTYVGSTQHYFQSHAKDDETAERLAAALRKAARKAPLL